MMVDDEGLDHLKHIHRYGALTTAALILLQSVYNETANQRARVTQIRCKAVPPVARTPRQWRRQQPMACFFLLSLFRTVMRFPLEAAHRRTPIPYLPASRHLL